MKRFLVVAALAIASSFAAAASDLTDRIRAEAQRGADALIAGDGATLIAITHPRIVQELGGREAALASVMQGIADLKAEGVVLERVVVETPGEPIASGACVAMIVPQTKFLRTPEGRYRHVGHLLAVSEDGGASWGFIETSTLTAAMLAEYFPPLAGKITLPAPQEAERIGD